MRSAAGRPADAHRGNRGPDPVPDRGPALRRHAGRPGGADAVPPAAGAGLSLRWTTTLLRLPWEPGDRPAGGPGLRRGAGPRGATHGTAGLLPGRSSTLLRAVRTPRSGRSTLGVVGGGDSCTNLQYIGATCGQSSVASVGGHSCRLPTLSVHYYSLAVRRRGEDVLPRPLRCRYRTENVGLDQVVPAACADLDHMDREFLLGRGQTNQFLGCPR